MSQSPHDVDGRVVRHLFRLAATLRRSARRAAERGDEARARHLGDRATQIVGEAFDLLARLRLARAAEEGGQARPAQPGRAAHGAGSRARQRPGRRRT